MAKEIYSSISNLETLQARLGNVEHVQASLKGVRSLLDLLTEHCEATKNFAISESLYSIDELLGHNLQKLREDIIGGTSPT